MDCARSVQIVPRLQPPPQPEPLPHTAVHGSRMVGSVWARRRLCDVWVGANQREEMQGGGWTDQAHAMAPGVKKGTRGTPLASSIQSHTPSPTTHSPHHATAPHDGRLGVVGSGQRDLRVGTGVEGSSGMGSDLGTNGTLLPMGGGRHCAHPMVAPPPTPPRLSAPCGGWHVGGY